MLCAYADYSVQNAFSKCLGHTGFDIYATLTVDLLHEFEIGAWKSLFIHLIRILDASSSGSTLIHELDRRSAPYFGCGRSPVC